jgi:hypothetical protein
MAFWIIWMPCWTAAPPVSAEARLGAWKQMMAMRIITTQYLWLSPTTLNVGPRKPPHLDGLNIGLAPCTRSDPARRRRTRSARRRSEPSTASCRRTGCRSPCEAQDEQRPDRDHEGQEELRERDDEERDAQEDHEPMEKTTAAKTRSSRMIPASFSMSSDQQAGVVVERPAAHMARSPSSGRHRRQERGRHAHGQARWRVGHVADVEARLQGERQTRPILKTFHMKVGSVSETSLRSTAHP